MRPRGYTVIELVLVLSLIAIMSALAIPRISFTRYRQDANGRLVQRTLLRALQSATKYNTNVLFVMDFSNSRMQVVRDTNSNGAADASEPTQSWKLAEGARFSIPTTTVDGATAYYATGAGIMTVSGRPALTFYPDGSASGNAYIYLGLASGNSSGLRAIEFEGATGRSRRWRYLSGAWRRDST